MDEFSKKMEALQKRAAAGRAAARERLEHEAKIDAESVKASVLGATGSPVKEEESPGKHQHTQSEECMGCFYTLGKDAVLLGCGHPVTSPPMLCCA